MYECHFCRASGGYTIRAPGCELGSGETLCEDYPGPRSGMGVGRCKRRPTPARGGGEGAGAARLPACCEFLQPKRRGWPSFTSHVRCPPGLAPWNHSTQRQNPAALGPAACPGRWGRHRAECDWHEQLRPEAGRSGPQEANARRFSRGGLGVNKPHT